MADAVLSDQQRDEIEQIIANSVAKSGLSAAQKWETGLILATMLAGTLAIFGTAGYFLIVNAAKEATSIIAPRQVADALIADSKFVEDIRTGVGLAPSGSVIAFDIAAGCPPGWTSFVNAAGRVIVGAGQLPVSGNDLSKRGFQEQGGSEFHNISVAELPPRDIGIVVASVSKVDRYNAGGTNYPVITASPQQISVGGIGAPISIMPPYIALHYCKKN